jgi:sulfatase-modifying factor enzyme 1
LAVLSRPRAVLMLALPVTVIAVTAALTTTVTAGCTMRSTAKSEGDAVDRAGISSLSANLPAAFAKAPSHRSDRAARTLTSAPSRGLLPLAQGQGADTPLDQLLRAGDRPLEGNGLCPPDMASIDDRYCVDRYEASLLELLSTGEEVAFSPYQSVDGRFVRAVSEPGVFPQGYISANQAQEACRRSGKRLCKPAEWRNACMGPSHTTYGYGNTNEPHRCNDHGRSPVVAMFGHEDLSDHAKWNWDRMNHPMLNQISDTLAHTGDHPDCTNDYGVFDMVGNLHEWVADPNGTFLGGYYQDTQINGEGCTYTTTAHAAWYHDYSTGFRCCADVGQ